MLMHAHNVVGVEVFFGPLAAVLACDVMPKLPMTAKRLQRSTAEHKKSGAMLLPRGAELYSIFSDVRQGLFVQTQGCESLFMLQTRWVKLRKLLPADSSCLVLVYENKHGVLTMGVYDVLRVEGVDQKQLTVYERQEQLSSLFEKAPALEGIDRHWVGEEEALSAYMQSIPLRDLPFEVDHMLRLPDRQQCAQEQYHRILRPICTQSTQ